MYIYKCKDKRWRCVFKDENGNMHTQSYPRYLIEQSIGRKLNANEDVHHIDGNVDNNELSNLEIRLHGEHQREHSIKYHDKIVNCFVCGKSFIWTAKQQRYRKMNGMDDGKYFCSKSCVGKYGKKIQSNVGMVKLADTSGLSPDD